jgi:ATP-dependent Lhr-like helicase
MEAVVRFVTGRKALVFVNSRREAENVMNAISPRVGNVHIHHSSVSTPMRKAAEEAFSHEGGACIICTSTLELGIDIGDLDIVVQVGPPASVSSFLQRMGRSGRRGKAAYVAWILRDSCEFLCSAAILECAMRRRVEPLRPQQQPYNCLAQQMMLNLHRNKRTTRKHLDKALRALPPFAGLPPVAVGRLIDHAIAEGYITTDGDMLMLGDQAERVFGMANYRDLYSVITGSESFRAVTPDGEVIGTLDARFVAGKSGGDFSLGGRVWQMIKCDEGHNLVVVVPGTEQTSRAFWTGSGHSVFSPLVCRTVQEIVSRKGTTLPLLPREQEVLAERIRHLPGGILSTGLFVRERKFQNRVEAVVFSFNGGSFNRLLTILLSRLLGGRATVRYSDFVVLVKNAGKDGVAQRVAEALRAIQAFDRDAIRSRLPAPAPSGWKFGSLLPADLLQDMALSEQYNVTEFMAAIGDAGITVIHGGVFPSLEEMPRNDVS